MGTAGTIHTLTCDVSATTSLDTSVTPNVTWFGPGIGSGRDSDFTEKAMAGSNMYTSTLQLSPLSTSDAGRYLCNVIFYPAPGAAYITASAVTSSSQTLQVAGMRIESIGITIPERLHNSRQTL